MAEAAKPNLDTKHPDYEATAALRTMGRDLFEGDAAVKAKGKEYLFQERNEDSEDYNLRLKRAVLDPYVGKIITARQAILFRREPTRTVPKPLEEYVDDVDLKGTSASTFFADAARDAQVDGVHWVLVDMPRAPQQPAAQPASAKAEREMGMRPFMEHVPGANVIDWQVGADRKLLWAVVAQDAVNDRPEPGVAHKTRPQRKIWTREKWELHEQAEGGKYAKVAEGPNPIGEVPLVAFLGTKRTDYSGLPVAHTVFPHVIAIYNKTSDMDWFERLSAHPIPIVIGPAKPVKLDAGAGTWLEARTGVQTEAMYLETTGAGFKSLRESIDALERKIFSIALAQAQQKATAQVQAADSQREDRKIFTSSLREESISYEEAELRCWVLMMLWSGHGDEGAEVKYDRDFDDAAIEAAMIETLLSLCDRGMLRKKTVLETLERGEVVDLPDGVEKELKEAQKEAAGETADAAAATLTRLKADEASSPVDDEDDDSAGDGDDGE
jgi:hypothetical protein